MTAITNALIYGYPSHMIVNHLMKKFPKHAAKFQAAQAAGYTADQILRHVSRDKKGREPEIMTEYMRARQNDEDNTRKAGLKVLAAMGTVGAVAAAAGTYAMRNQAVQPSQILPARGQPPQAGRPGQTINVQPRRPGGGGAPGMLPAPAQARQQPNVNVPPNLQKQLPYLKPQGQPPAQPQAPTRPQAPQGMPPQARPPQQNSPSSIFLDRMPGFKKRAVTMAQAGNDPAMIAAYFSAFQPRDVITIEKETGMPFDQLVTDYFPSIQQEIESRPDLSQGAQMPMQPQGMQQPEQQAMQQEQPMPEEMQQMAQEQTQEAPFIPEPEMQQQAQPSLQQRTQQAAFSGEKPRDIGQVKPINKSSFAIPLYHYKGESKEDFVSRKIMNDAVKKAANALKEGKNFLDFPKLPDVQYSTANDVLKFIAGVPGVYDSLLSDEEKDELFEGVEGKDRDIWGAQITPNLVWNLLLSVEPRINKIERPPSVKGYKPTAEGKMNKTEMKRFLTHAVYGAISGKNISPDLSDKINRISNATTRIDAIARAAKAGDARRIEMEMEKIMTDDEHLWSLFNQEVPELMDFMERKEAEMTPEERKEDTRLAAAQKAKTTKAAKKKVIENAD